MTVALALLIVVGMVAEASDDVDREPYVRANMHLLGEIPTFPGAVLLRVESKPWTIQREPLPWSYIAGYGTTATYQAAPQTTPAEVTRFFRARLTGWRPASWSKIPEGWPRVYRMKDAKRSVENRCYARGVESVCIDLLGFLVSGKIVSGGRFHVTVDNRVFKPRSNW